MMLQTRGISLANPHNFVFENLFDLEHFHPFRRMLRPSSFQTKLDGFGPFVARNDGSFVRSIVDFLPHFAQIAVVFGKGHLQGHELPQQDGKGKDIAFVIVGIGLGHLGCHVRQTSRDARQIKFLVPLFILFGQFLGRTKIK